MMLKFAKCQHPETEKIKLVWTHHEKGRRQPLKKNDGHGFTGEGKKGAPRWIWIDNSRKIMTKYELTAESFLEDTTDFE